MLVRRPSFERLRRRSVVDIPYDAVNGMCKARREPRWYGMLYNGQCMRPTASSFDVVLRKRGGKEWVLILIGTRSREITRGCV
jgi:hypothetical protein